MSVIHLKCQVSSNWSDGTMWEDEDFNRLNDIVQSYIKPIYDPVFPVENDILKNTLKVKVDHNPFMLAASTLRVEADVLVTALDLPQQMIDSTKHKPKEITYYKTSKDKAGKPFRWIRTLRVKFEGPIKG